MAQLDRSTWMTAADLALRLDHVRPLLAGGYSARCPAHDDRRPSLTFRDGYRRVLVRCWAGCAVGDITAALGLSIGDLFLKRGLRSHRFKEQYRPRRDEWAVLWSETLRKAAEQGCRSAEWAPLWMVSDFIRRSLNAADRAKKFATMMGEQDPPSWPLVERAARIEAFARWVETAIDAIMADGRIA